MASFLSHFQTRLSLPLSLCSDRIHLAIYYHLMFSRVQSVLTVEVEIRYFLVLPEMFCFPNERMKPTTCHSQRKMSATSLRNKIRSNKHKT